jgi:large subunit ribosomal protein L21
MGEHRGEKIDGFKYKNKTGYRRRYGHRQTYTTVTVKKITMTSTKKKTASKAKDKAVAEEK